MIDKTKYMKLDTAIKLSIIIPAYNAERSIERVLCSIVGKTIDKIEIIVVNDSSTDKTAQIVSNILFQNVRLINLEKNMGVSSALNRGLDVAKGEYIAFIDADDWVEPDFLDNIYKIISNGSIDMILFGHRNIETSGKHNISPNFDENHYVSEYILDEISSVRWNKIYQRSIIDEHDIRFQKMIRGEDGLFNMEYIFYVNKIKRLNQILYNYDRREVSTTRQGYSFDIITIHEDMLSRDLKIIRKHSQNYNDELFVRRFRFIVIHSIFSLYYDLKNERLDDELVQKVRRYISEQFKFGIILKSKYMNFKEKILYFSFLVSPKISFFLLNKFNY